ncbi:hypothetical protein AUK40_02865 [Candidatus Wirthbacteria bacterium CG2_30_54_11]|uniref:Probable acyltransferase n=1 Tax=Candidatus Wirthbacteria bacterium CG2_30_54_11 TaxID=1817892 RepID=A0A1J5ILF7_9BACT|nr:MAG: hypothetical protein AUK40_02865 [Candidatus Wirthbacteria bacterium CG2_30_54_11]
MATAHLTYPLRLGVLNLMPDTWQTETELLGILPSVSHAIEITWLTVETHRPSGRHTDTAYVNSRYRSFWEAGTDLDGLIVTGAPLEHLAFEAVDYWAELADIMDYTRQHVACTVHIGWAALAAAYHFYGLTKENCFPRKIAGVYPLQKAVDVSSVFTDGIDAEITLCQSRHAYLREEKLQPLFSSGDLVPLFTSEETLRALEGQVLGTSIFASRSGRELFNLGHFEYGAATLDREWLRDQIREVPLDYEPEHYYQDVAHQRDLPLNTWIRPGRQFFVNFVRELARVKGTVAASEKAPVYAGAFSRFAPAVQSTLT